MNNIFAQLSFDTPEKTGEFAQQLGSILTAGDVVLLVGDIGAGKSYLARALIQSVQDIPEDVPSPTFTLVQTYDTRIGEIWHADLYRLTGPDEVIELGLEDAFETAVCLIEWPDRLGDLTPENGLTLDISVTGADARQITLASNDPTWPARMTAIHND